jgi:hypothetical protein
MKARRQQNRAVAELGKGSVMDGTAQEKLQRWPPEAGAARRRQQLRLGSIAAWRYSSAVAFGLGLLGTTWAPLSLGPFTLRPQSKHTLFFSCTNVLCNSKFTRRLPIHTFVVYFWKLKFLHEGIYIHTFVVIVVCFGSIVVVGKSTIALVFPIYISTSSYSYIVLHPPFFSLAPPLVRVTITWEMFS